VTYLTAYAGVPAVFVSHHTIVAYDTRQHKLANVGFAVPFAGATSWATGVDGAIKKGAMPDADTVWLHQFRDDAVRLNEVAAGKRADGWMAAINPRAAVVCTLRDMWQKFPKELEAGRDGLTLDFWPRHGLDTFSSEDQLDPKQIFKARFAHQGKLLDLQMPQSYFDALEKNNRWDVEHTVPIGFASTAEGVSIGNDFALWFQDASQNASAWSELARRFQDPPHALANSAWNVSAGVESPMAARDDKRWPLAERLLNHDYPRAMLGTLAYTGSYGMWIYANTFNTWRGDWPGLHRIWENSHYGQIGESWKLYFRGGSPDILRWARAQTDHYMNIATVHYAIPGVSPPGRQVGAMYHVKGFLPWGARQRGQFATDRDVDYWGHFIDPDAYLWEYLLEGDLFARDLYRTWIGTTKRGLFPTHGAGREAINDVAMLLNAYAMTWDPQMVLQLHRRGVDITLETALEKASNAGSFPVWHKRWADRYYALARDPRAVDVINNYIRAGFHHWAPSAFVYRNRPDDALIKPLLPEVYTLLHRVYRHPGDPFDGFGEYTDARGQEQLLQLTELLYVLDEMGLQESSLPLPQGYYPPTDVLAWNPDGRDFSIKIEMPFNSRNADHSVYIKSPSGKVVRVVLIGKPKGAVDAGDETTIVMNRGRFVGDSIQHIAVPAHGEKGLYTISLGGLFCYMASPMTDLPAEAAILAKDRFVRPGGSFAGVIAAPAGGAVEFTVNGLGQGTKPPLIPTVTWMRLGDETAAPRLETSLLNIGQSKQATVTLPASPKPRFYPFALLGEASFGWTGEATHLLLAPSEKDAATILPLLP
jgi:hypothetical protein